MRSREGTEADHRRELPLQATPSRWHATTNSTALLVALSGASYLTTFARERYFYQHEYGTHTLDRVVVLMSALAIVSNIAGLVLLLLWVGGRLRSGLALRGLSAFVFLACLAAFKSYPAGEALGIAIASCVFIVACQRASANGRLAYALIGAVTALGPTLVVWNKVGTATAAAVLAGYLAGACWQAGWAVAAGVRATPSPSPGAMSSPLWPLLYTSAIQADALADQAVLLRAGAGWAGADALAYNFFIAAVITVVSPMSSQDLAGRLHLRDRKRLIWLAVGVALAFMVVVLLGLGRIVQGGALHSSGVSRLRNLSLVYGAAIPFAIYWNFHTRAAHRNGSSWMAIAISAVILFSAHLAVLLPIAALNVWVLVPLGTTISFAIVAILWSRGVLRPKA